MTRSFYTDAATRLRYPTVDDHGAEVPDLASEPQETEITGRLQHITVDEALEHRIGSDVRARWLGDLDVDLQPTDQLVIDGITYEVASPPMRQRSPRGGADHSETFLRWSRG